jgi:hypothetical protein
VTWYTGPRQVLSGGQTGADRGGLEAALQLGIPIGGWAPLGYRAEDGRIPERYAAHLREHPSRHYPHRTEANVQAADVTLVLTYGPPDRGSGLTVELCRRHGRPVLAVDPRSPDVAARIMIFLVEHRPGSVNVAGNRESRSPGIGKVVCTVLHSAFTACMVGASGRMLTAHEQQPIQKQGTRLDMMNSPFGPPAQNFAQPAQQTQPAAQTMQASAPVQAPTGFPGMQTGAVAGGFSQTAQVPGGFPAPGQGMPNFNPLSGMGDVDAAPSGGSDYLGNGMYILMINLAKFKLSRKSAPLYTVEAQVIAALESTSHGQGSPASWQPKLDEHGKKDIKQFLGATVLGLDVRKDLERVNKEVTDPILQASITLRQDGQPALAGRFVAVTVKVVPQKNDPSKNFSKHFWHPVSETELDQARAAGGFAPEAVARICRGG